MIDVTRMQQRLLKAGYAIGLPDGVAGRQTMAGLLAHVAGRQMSAMLALGEGCAVHLPRFGLLDTAPRLASWLGQAAHESGGFRYLREIWGPTDAQRRYEGRSDLGNSEPGDGKRFLGRGLFQVTGRANYNDMAMRTGLPLLDQPELVEQPATAVLTACLYWQTRKLSLLADAGRDDEITHRINGGENGIAERRRLVARAKALLI